jgi:hypothetical protein
MQRRGFRNPTTGIVGCCARAGSGQAAAPTRNAMNSRRLMCSPLTRVSAYHTARGEAALCTTANLHARCL